MTTTTTTTRTDERPGLADHIVSTSTIVVPKDTPDSKMGVGLGTTHNRTVLITCVREGGMLHTSGHADQVEVGMILLAINGTKPKHAEDAAHLLAEAPVGPLTLELATAKPGSFRIRGVKTDQEPVVIKYKPEETMIVTKPFKAPIGVVIGKSAQSGECLITACEAQSVAAQAGLQILMALRKVNGVAINSPQQCATLLKNASGKFPVVVAAQVLPEDVPLSESARSQSERRLSSSNRSNASRK